MTCPGPSFRILVFPVNDRKCVLHNRNIAPVLRRKEAHIHGDGDCATQSDDYC